MKNKMIYGIGGAVVLLILIGVLVLIFCNEAGNFSPPTTTIKTQESEESNKDEHSYQDDKEDKEGIDTSIEKEDNEGDIVTTPPVQKDSDSKEEECGNQDEPDKTEKSDIVELPYVPYE